MITTSFTRLVGCPAPIQLAGMPLISSPDLVVAVAEAGGLGMMGAPLLTPEALGQILDAIGRRTRGAVGVNFLVPFLDPLCVEVAAARARVVEFFYGAPSAELVALAHAGGALAGWQVGSRDEAVAAEQTGCDFIVAQGVEAGGHVRGQIGLLPLLEQTLAAVRCPVVAAGGIATARGLAAVLAAGAGGARIGTRFVAAAESGAHPRYVERLLAAAGEDTVYTEAFSVMWPNAPHRVLRESIAAAEAIDEPIVGEVDLPTGPMPVPRLSVVAPSRETRGRIEAMALYAGQSVGAVAAVQPVAEIMRELVEGAERLLSAAVASSD